MNGRVRTLANAAILYLCAAPVVLAAEQTASIRQVQAMPDIPTPCIIKDWKQTAIDQDKLLFDPNAKGQYMPLIHILVDVKLSVDVQLGTGKSTTVDSQNKITTFGLPDYVGDLRQADGRGAGITDIGAVWGATLVGIDKSKGPHDYVKMCAAHFDPRPSRSMIGNDLGHCDPEKTFWYTIFPNVVFASVADRYPDETEINDMAHKAAGSWEKATDALKDPSKDDAANYDHTGFNFDTMTGVDNGTWKEPDAGAGVAWLEYTAYNRWHEAGSLIAADRCMRYLEQRPANLDPFYEILMPFGALTAVRMNAELGRNYDTSKMINWCFDRSAARPDWKVNTDRWEGIDTAGLVGGTNGPPRLPGVGGYGFAMNTFVWAWPLVPVARYDPRYAKDLGKWMLNAASAARLYYADTHARDRQTCPDWNGDPQHVIAYEGLKYRWDDANQPMLGTGDPIHEHWGPKTDFGLYGSVYVGVYGGLIAPTSDPQILRIDLLATDTAHPKAYPSYLYYNPHPDERKIEIDAGTNPVDVYDAVSGKFVARGISGSTTLNLPASQAVVAVLTPSGGTVTHDGSKMLVNGIVIDYRSGSEGK